MEGDRNPQHPDVHTLTLQQVLEALVDPVRRSIVTRLHEARTDLKCGSFDLPVGKSTATHHFRILREAGLIRQYYAGTARMNALRYAEIDEVFPGLLGAVIAADRAASSRLAPA
ncbi:ArsR/SmtB family transcription factor [Streptomyces hoynatensis]|uniref:Transcriptional regulator n=1 Tax=Streptomyces hoynatensis TaxID=1141874 RepID=A0A3A9YKK7_9ACTN|nr:helix-turn-helix transcriptional regulator [Streptomyces hoynatensis]RKN37001.1 transcriptional regulator [Streptomyces hoynatensis]